MILGPHHAAALIARERPSPVALLDGDRRFNLILTCDRVTVTVMRAACATASSNIATLAASAAATENRGSIPAHRSADRTPTHGHAGVWSARGGTGKAGQGREKCRNESPLAGHFRFPRIARPCQPSDQPNVNDG
jgi:hypothetical protein